MAFTMTGDMIKRPIRSQLNGRSPISPPQLNRIERTD
jgi:hypothetical protein